MRQKVRSGEMRSNKLTKLRICQDIRTRIQRCTHDTVALCADRIVTAL